jgi:hypothetical protein
VNLTFLVIGIVYIISVPVCYFVNKWLSIEFWNPIWTTFDKVMCSIVSLFSIIGIIMHIFMITLSTTDTRKF